MRVLGIDFGTSNTVAMLRTADGRVRPLLFDGSPLLPSAVYLGNDGRMVVGRDAERNARVDPSRFEPNPKRRIDDVTILLGDRELPVSQVIATVLGQVATEVRRQIGAPPDEVRMTHPAQWAERRRAALLDAAGMSGLPRPKLIAEPVAAASYFTAVLGTAVPIGRSLAIYDLGGGTFDATVVRRTGSGFEVLAEGGLPDVGGLDFDHAVVQHLGRIYSESHPAEWRRLENPVEGSDRRHRRMLWEDVRGAKEMLSRTSAADIHLPALEVDAHLTREELEGLIRPHLDRTVTCLTTTISEARLAPRDLVGIFLVGGSSRIPMAAHLIHTTLGVAPTTLEQPETVVSEGSLRVGAIPDTDNTGGVRPVTPPPPPRTPVGPPAMSRPGPPMAGPARPIPPRPGPGPARPISAPPPMSRPAPPQPRPPQPVNRPVTPPPIRPMAAPMPQAVAKEAERRWYQEPAVVVTLVIATLLVVGFVFLLFVALLGDGGGSELTGGWLPADFVHPVHVPVPGTALHLRPIREADTAIDYPAVMGSQARLWATFGPAWGWPPATMTYERDRADLLRHEREIAAHQSFNYALLDEAESALFGCVYIDPPERTGADGEIAWWVIDELAGGEAERALDALVPAWIAADWPFTSPRYLGRDISWADWLALPRP